MYMYVHVHVGIVVLKSECCSIEATTLQLCIYMYMFNER